MNDTVTQHSNHRGQLSTYICQCGLCQRGGIFREKLKNVKEEDQLFFELLYNNLCDTEVELEMIQYDKSIEFI